MYTISPNWNILMKNFTILVLGSPSQNSFNYPWYDYTHHHASVEQSIHVGSKTKPTVSKKSG